jgi:PIN domain nuclease of toxin-antitoxin system
VNPLLIMDSHIWFWWTGQTGRLPGSLEERIESGAEALAISSISIYEIVLQVQRGRLAIDLPLDEWLHAATVEAGVSVLDVNLSITRQAALLPLHHGDPLDRIIIATALHHDAYLASVDTRFPDYRELTGRLLDGKSA